MLKLYSYFRSTAAYRVRIALELKKIKYEVLPVHLLKNGGEQKAPAYLEINPQGLVPTLQDGDFYINQSLAIIDYLDESYSQPPLLPADSKARATLRALADMIACDIHPLNNLRVLQYLKDTLKIDEQAKMKWYQHWIKLGFKAIEQYLKDHRSDHFCYKDSPTVADICLIPQVYNALRFSCPVTEYPRIMKIYEHCMDLPAFINAAPEQQIDAE